ncbi:cell division protein FtsK [Hyphomicrobium methylovorum]|uniref:DNA translocase FtsK n=1 Tax=Hyphomicrobium methylovorum TaxID=84 RepID=UPI0015E77349|nr:DNA translocase FtsK [Hyphomicrobium methylovorum]MBA2126158.1 cell division protein FtsK [Hyphomicrobium methylovorum]
MSLDARGIDPQRLLPQSLEDRLLGWLGRCGGAALLVATVAIWASLVSWSVFDPSLTHTTTASARNFAGPVGAIISDLLFQMLGFAAVLALVAPLVWSVEMLRSERVSGGRTKLGFYPLSVLAISGAISALPLFEGWPLRHGYGGLLGDGVLHLFTKVFSFINADRAGLAAGVILGAAAVQMAGKAIGFEGESLIKGLLSALRSLVTRSQAAAKESVVAARVHRSSFDSLELAEPSIEHEAATDRQEPAFERRSSSRPTLSIDDPVETFAPQPKARPSLSAGLQTVERRRSDDDGLEDFVDDEIEVDLGSDASSIAIARRFAPESAKNARPHAPLEESLPIAAPVRTPRPAPRAAEPPSPPPPPPPPEAALAKASGLLGGFVRGRAESEWKRPSLNVFKRPGPSKPKPELSQTVMRGNARLLEDVLADFGVKGEVRDIRPGPVVTLFEFEPSRGTKSSRVIGLAEDIARSMSIGSVRAAVVSGRNAIGLELPNARRETVLLREILESDTFKSDGAGLPLGLGKSIGGDPVVVDLARMPHLLVAGTTGSGKSVGINSMVLSLLYRHAPEDCRMLMIDPKMLELSVYNGIPHLLTPVITDPHKAVAALNWVVREMEERYKRMAAISVRNIDVFNNRVRNAKKRGEILSRTVQTGFDKSGQARFETQQMELEPFPRIVVIVDEFADLMLVAGREVEGSVQRLAQMARAAGIHLIMATQRPSVDIITGTIKANFPTRISFKVTSKIDSRTILNEQGAEQLLGQGDMLYSNGAGQSVRVHGAFVSDEEVVAFSDALRAAAPPNYVEGITDAPPQSEIAPSGREGGDQDLYDRAVAIVLKDGKASTSYIQRRLSIGYNRAADLIERMEREGLISAANSVGKREILAA